jgi:hypothetical protein
MRVEDYGVLRKGGDTAEPFFRGADDWWLIARVFDDRFCKAPDLRIRDVNRRRGKGVTNAIANRIMLSWLHEQTAGEALRARTATSMHFLIGTEAGLLVDKTSGTMAAVES